MTCDIGSLLQKYLSLNSSSTFIVHHYKLLPGRDNMKSHARKQLLYWPLCCGVGTKSSVDRSAVVWESKEEAEEEETRKLNYRRLRILHESGEGEPQPWGEPKKRASNVISERAPAYPLASF